MTLIVSVIGRETIWMLADRRLSAAGRKPKDDARKLLFLETSDGVAILGYSGLGATTLGTEPADWMLGVLRGRNLPMEQSLDVLAAAIKAQLPQHLVKIPDRRRAAHQVLIPALIANEARFYSVDVAVGPTQQDVAFRWTRWVINESKRPLRTVVGGSGAEHLLADRSWRRPLLRLIAAHDKKRISSTTVADYLATLNTQVHGAMKDQSVGDRCFVAWRHRKGGVFGGGGGHYAYSGIKREGDTPILPTLGTGMDVSLLAELTMKFFGPGLEAALEGRVIEGPDPNEINAEIARRHLPPDDKLR